MKNYTYDVFLSFTGADREMKNEIRVFLEEKGLKCYDSDLYCMGHFREDFCEALDQSKVYLMILTDNLKNDPMISNKGCLTEVRRECSLACQLEAANELNIAILCMSEFFRFDRPFHNYNDTIGWHFYSHTRGFSQIYGQKNEDGTLAERTLNEIHTRCSTFVERRDANCPVLSQMPKIDIATEKLINDEVFKGRERETEQTLQAFAEGKQLVVLRGSGGIGKTSLATEIAKRCEELEYLKCPQIVHIPDMVTRGDGVANVVSAVNYTDTVYDSLVALSEQERFERKLAALRSLPETHLLVIDNFNSVTSGDIRALLSKLKCRLLITTRATVEEQSGVAVIPIDSLSRETAKEVFEEISKSKVSPQAFENLYETIGGHTITLCIMAKMMAVHEMQIDELLGELEKESETEARVDFVHNAHGSMDTVMGHLRTLFNISDLRDGAMQILRSMSLLSDGAIPTQELTEALGLKNRNDVLELVKNGWLDRQSRENEEGALEYLYLHPILSLLMADLLTPTEENTAEMIAHIIQKVDLAKRDLSYADATELENKLFYACYVLAGGSHKLCGELWSRFTEINHLLSDSEHTGKKVHQLAKRIDDPGERSLVLTYGDMITIEQFPTRVDLLDKYIQSLGSHTNDYKWVIRSLSVMAHHVLHVEKYRPFLKDSIEKAAAVAMEKDDHFALLDLMVSGVSLSGKDTTLWTELKNYIAREKRSGNAKDSLLYLEYYVTYFSLFSSKELKEIVSTLYSMIDGVFNDGGQSKMLGLLCKHPLIWMRMNRLANRLEHIETADPVLRALQLGYNEGIRLAEDGQLDMMTVIQAAIELHMYRMERQQTLASAAESIMGVIALLDMFPEGAVKRSAGNLAEMVDMNNITVKGLANLQVAVLINQHCGNREAIAQSRRLIDAVRRLRPKDHSDVIHALKSYGDICCFFGENEEGVRAYVEAYKMLAVTVPDSSVISEISRKLLRLSVFAKQYDVETVTQIGDAALKELDMGKNEYYSVLHNYIFRLLEKAERGEMVYEDARISGLLALYTEAAAKVKGMNMMMQRAYMFSVHDTASVLANFHQFEQASALCALIKTFMRSRYKESRNCAAVYSVETAGYICYKKGEADEAKKYFEKTVRCCIKRHAYLSAACIVFWLMISYPQYRGAAAMVQALIQDPHKREILERYIGEWCEECAKKSAQTNPEILDLYCGRHIAQKAKEYAYKDMNFSMKEFKQLRNEEEFYFRVLERLIRSK